jgi:hypothetical protein
MDILCALLVQIVKSIWLGRILEDLDPLGKGFAARCVQGKEETMRPAFSIPGGMSGMLRL